MTTHLENHNDNIDISFEVNLKATFNPWSSSIKRGLPIFFTTVLCFTITACDLSSEERQQYFSWASDQTTTWQEQPMHEQDYRSCNSTNRSCQAMSDISTPKKGVFHEH